MLKISMLTTGLLVPGVAAAAVGAHVTTDLNIRTGPGVSYPRFDTIPDGARVTVYGCRDRSNWCDIGWRGERGWVSGNYLAYSRARPQVGVSIGLPIIGFDPGRPWFRDRARDRDDHADIRRERRDVREARQDVREARRELRQARRSGEDLTDKRRDLRQAQRVLLREQHQLARERRQL